MVEQPGGGREQLARLWSLDERVIFLNHGSFGACPTRVLEHQQALRERMERQPVQMLQRDLPELATNARRRLSHFVGADPEGLAFVRNATAGVNTVLRSQRLRAGDELLVTNHAYGACRHALDFVAEQAGARVVVVKVAFPVSGADAIFEAVMAAVTERTALALIDHVTSPTALIFPVERLVPALQARGVRVLIDGAHAPGMLALDLEALGADYYVGNCHKWLCAPKSVGFLSVAAQHREHTRPLVISWGAGAPPERRFREEFDWLGTQDPTPMLCVPEAIDVLGALLPGGWDAVRARNHALAVEAQALLCDALEIEPPCPSELLGSMAAVPIRAGNPHTLQRILLEDHRIELPVNAREDGTRLLRASTQLYNSRAHCEALAEAVPRALATEKAG